MEQPECCTGDSTLEKHLEGRSRLHNYFERAAIGQFNSKFPYLVTIDTV